MSKKLMMIGMFLVALLTGCSHDESPEGVDSKETKVSAEFVSADEAKTIAAAVQFGTADATTADGKATTRSAGLNKEVQSVTPVPDASGATAFYVINYKGGGFMILAADKRMNPVLAFSETSTFPLNDPEGAPESLTDWMANVKDQMQTLRVNNELLTETMVAAWEPESIQTMLFGAPTPPPSKGVDPDEGDNCKNESKTYGPFLRTTWHQGPNYNDLIPIMGCDPSYNYKAPVGCVAVAVAQVMKYYRYPTSYNWDNMPNTWATEETAKLMKDVGAAVKMKYGCNGSSSNLKKAAKALTDVYHYRSAKYKGSIEQSIVESEIISGRPVILAGVRYKGGFFQYAGHAWVCDGYKYSLIYYHKCRGGLYEWFHMNWGLFEYAGTKYNGWYDLKNLRPREDLNYNLSQDMVYEIIP